MDAQWLAPRLEAGRSIESIAREAGRSPSTVGYWVNKHDLTSTHAAKHAARGGIDRDTLEALVEEGRSIREIAAEVRPQRDRRAPLARQVRAQDQPAPLRGRQRREAAGGDPRV